MTNNDFKLDLKTVREMKRQLESSDTKPSDDYYTFPIKIALTVDGVVLLGLNMMHPESFRVVFGEEEYQKLLKQPRVANPYGDEDD